jgi:hypothetical protein
VTTSATPGGHEERASEHAGCGEGDDAGEDIRCTVAEWEEHDAGHGRREAQRGEESLERGAEVLGRGVPEEVEEHHHPEQERDVP